jgi:hypothetical protein
VHFLRSANRQDHRFSWCQPKLAAANGGQKKNREGLANKSFAINVIRTIQMGSSTGSRWQLYCFRHRATVLARLTMDHGIAERISSYSFGCCRQTIMQSLQIIKNPARLARLTTASLAVALSILGGFPDAVQPAAAQTSGYPDATNTGVPAGTALTVVNGGMTITTSGAIVENKDIRGCVTVNATNVIIRKSKVSCSGQSVIWSGSTNLLVEDVEIACGGTPATTALTPANYTSRRVNAYGCENIMWAERNVTIEDSYLHDPIPYNPQTDPHTDSVQIPGGGSNITIRHNRIYGGYISGSNFGNSAITMGGGTSNIIVDNNVLAGGGYTMYCNQGGRGTNDVYRNNRFSRVLVSTVGGFGPWTDCTDENISGNVYHETGLLLPGQSTPPPPAAPTALRIIR